MTSFSISGLSTVGNDLEAAENSVRSALVKALNQKDDLHISSLFEILSSIKKVRNHYPLVTSSLYTSNPQEFWEEDGISLTGNPSAASPDTIYISGRDRYNFNLTSDYIPKVGKDLDNLDKVIDFPPSLG